MITTTSMQQLIAAVLKSDMDAATRALLRVGVIDFIDVREIPADWTSQLDRMPAAEDREKARELRLRLDAYFRTVGFTPRPVEDASGDGAVKGREGAAAGRASGSFRGAGSGTVKAAADGADSGSAAAGRESVKREAAPPEQAGPIDLDHAEQEIEKLAGEFRKIRDRQKEVQNEVLRIEELRRQMPSTSGEDHMSPQLAKGTHSYITIHTGTLPAENRAQFEAEIAKFPSVFLPEQDREPEGPEPESGGGPIDFLITLKRDDSRVERVLERYGWQEKQYEAGSEVTAGAGRDRGRESGGGGAREADSRGTGRAGGARDRSSKSTGGKQARGSRATTGSGPRLPVEELDAKLESLRLKQKELDQSLGRTVQDRSDKLQKVWTGLRMRELVRTIQGYYRRTERTYLFSGWLPAHKKQEVTEALMEATEGRCYLEWHTPHMGGDPEVPEQVPVQMENPPALRPFQSLVENYGIPTYGSIDPTPIVAVFYLAMFALMFGDVGHGLVVLFIGLIGDRLSRKKGKKTMLFPLIGYCGGAAIISGALFGSYFGMPLLPPLWFDYHGIVAGHGGGAGSVKTMSDILLITIYFGIAVIATGLIINWINRIRRGDWIGLVWGNGGMLVGWLYAAGTYSAFYFVGHDYRQLPPGPALIFLLGIPVLLLGTKPVIEHIQHNRAVPPEQRHSANILDMFMEWLVELLEIFSGYLSNTLSFMRVAGLGIAHVSLMMAFFQIAEMAASDGRFTLWSYLILLLGNALVIGLEGLSAGIQSLRLNYYEFFSKYFTGNGRAYAPISLRSE